MFSFVGTFLNWSKKSEKTVPLTRVHTGYGEMFADVAGYMGQQARRKEDLDRMERENKEFKGSLIETFEEYCNSVLYTLKYHLPDHTL